MKRCQVTDLLEPECAHCAHHTTTVPVLGPPVEDRPASAGTKVPLDYAPPRWDTAPTARQAGRRTPDTWHTQKWSRLVCDHGKPEGMMLCPTCTTRLWSLLCDIPRIVSDLVVHLTKQNRFLERGIPQRPDEDEEPREKRDESPVPFNAAASSVLTELAQVLDGPPGERAEALLQDWKQTLRLPHLAEFASRLSAAAGKALRVVDVDPYLTLYGTCPECQKEIRQERVPDGGQVKCRCGYSARVDEHLLTQLELAADTQMTLTKVVEVLNDAGEHTSRQEIENLIYRQGLPREQVPVWVGGRLEKVWHYRLGDVREWRRRKRRTG